ncbi:hypothetical protein CEP54_013314 [Fusarium duplospermum]|uniref:Uncharacterized protein n=1 Tax=Fusarium duplospermum TaxID=1325734 RepID=A0A428P3K1_9HYPO|nr:hypothetical protein CEP54_013314 [Fusarium duplospermum]
MISNIASFSIFHQNSPDSFLTEIMTQLHNSRHRTRPDYSSDEEEASTARVSTPVSVLTLTRLQADFSQSTVGRYRSRVKKHSDKADFPLEPLYQVGETVYLSVPERQEPVGPYVIVSNDFQNQTYQIKRLDNGERYPGAVPESSLRVPGS